MRDCLGTSHAGGMGLDIRGKWTKSEVYWVLILNPGPLTGGCMVPPLSISGRATLSSATNTRRKKYYFMVEAPGVTQKLAYFVSVAEKCPSHFFQKYEDRYKCKQSHKSFICPRQFVCVGSRLFDNTSKFQPRGKTKNLRIGWIWNDSKSLHKLIYSIQCPLLRS